MPNFGTFITSKLRNCLLRTMNTVQHKISLFIFAADQGLFYVSHPVSTTLPASQVSFLITPSSAASSEDEF
jgi:hypothetical protein